MINRKLIGLLVSTAALFVAVQDAQAEKFDTEMSSGFWYNLFFTPDSDLEFADMEDMLQVKAPALPVGTDEDAIKHVLSQEAVQNHVRETIHQGHRTLPWWAFADKVEGAWIVKLRTVSFIPMYRCYYAIDESGKPAENSEIPFSGCKYYSNK